MTVKTVVVPNLLYRGILHEWLERLQDTLPVVAVQEVHPNFALPRAVGDAHPKVGVRTAEEGERDHLAVAHRRRRLDVDISDLRVAGVALVLVPARQQRHDALGLGDVVDRVHVRGNGLVLGLRLRLRVDRLCWGLPDLHLGRRGLALLLRLRLRQLALGGRRAGDPQVLRGHPQDVLQVSTLLPLLQRVGPPPRLPLLPDGLEPLLLRARRALERRAQQPDGDPAAPLERPAPLRSPQSKLQHTKVPAATLAILQSSFGSRAFPRYA
mmetsp:Transcript_6775/g.19826  ORF Transcript_6775/g.19826 Transcript_6775/m.19826 type:complete len:268 (-) Transcript_6775:54-857(-)